MRHTNELKAPKGVEIIVAVKYATTDKIAELKDHGFSNLGWSTIQHLEKTIKEKPEILKNYHHHFIGHLQTNKIKKLLAFPIELIHSVDSEKLLKEIAKEAANKNKTQPILLQINTDSEKEFGFSEEDIEKNITTWTQLPSINIQGFMTIPPPQDNEKNRLVFRNLKTFAKKTEEKSHISLPILSMGMSDDFSIAIEEGATHIRPGRIIFS